VLAEEVEELADRSAKPVPGGVELEGDLVDAAGLALWSRCAARVLVRIGHFQAASLEQLASEVKKLDLSPFLRPGQPGQVKAAVHKSRIRRADVAAAKVASVLRLAEQGRLAPLELLLRIEGKQATLSVDASGLLHKRGYRKATARAPLRENLAASVLRAAGWQPGVPLADPMCGSGSFSIEAALIAQDRAPGLERKPPVIRLPSFPAKVWELMLREAREATHPQEGWFHTADRDQRAIEAANANAQRARVELSPLHQDIAQPVESPPGPGLVVLNPPYGRRVGENAQLAGLYRRTGEALRRDYPGWRVAAVCPDKALAGRLGKGMEELTRFRNGGLQVSLWVGTIGA